MEEVAEGEEEEEEDDDEVQDGQGGSLAVPYNYYSSICAKHMVSAMHMSLNCCASWQYMSHELRLPTAW